MHCVLINIVAERGPLKGLCEGFWQLLKEERFVFASTRTYISPSPECRSRDVQHCLIKPGNIYLYFWGQNINS